MIFILIGICAVILGLFMIFGVNENNVYKFAKPKSPDETAKTTVKKVKMFAVILLILGIVCVICYLF